MGKFTQAIGSVFRGGAKAFSRFPAAMVSAVVIAAAASIRIENDSDAIGRILRNLQLAAMLGAFLGMALAVLALTRKFRPVLFALANLVALLAAGGVFWLLQQQAAAIPDMLMARLIAGSAISFLVFLLAVCRDIDRSDYSQSSFMTLKSALIALIYALVIMLGLFFVAFTVKSLLYAALREEVYSHIAVWSALAWFAFFLGYFPSFRQDQDDDHLAVAQKHPAFIEILFAYVMIPIMIVLTLVLLIWAIQILIVGNWQNFEQLAAIFSAYALFGIFLSLMVSHYTQSIARFFSRFFPLAAILFLAFEAYAMYNQIQAYGLKTSEYFFALVWIYALITALLLIILPARKYQATAWLAIVLIAAAVMPAISFRDLPVAAQTGRLRQVLSKNDMLTDNKIQLAPVSISDEDKAVITDASYFLFDQLDAVKAEWFTKSFTQTISFQTVYGFEPTEGANEPTGKEQHTSLYLPTGSLDISAYKAVGFRDTSSGSLHASVQGGKGTYTVRLENAGSGVRPHLTVTLNDAAFADQDLTEWLTGLHQKYQGSNTKGTSQASLDDMLVKVQKDGSELLIVFENIEITESANAKNMSYYLAISCVYLKED